MKALEFMRYRRPDLDIRPNFLHQLSAYEALLAKCGLGPKTTSWTGTFFWGDTTETQPKNTEVYEGNVAFENEELLLRNTYLNAHLSNIDPMTAAVSKPGMEPRKKLRGLQWVDSNPADGSTKNLATVIQENEDDDYQGPQGKAAKPSKLAPGAQKPKSILRKEAEPKRAAPAVVTTKAHPPIVKCKKPVEIQTEGSVVDFLKELDDAIDEPMIVMKPAAKAPVRPAPPLQQHQQKENLTSVAGPKQKSKLLAVPFKEESNIQHIHQQHVQHIPAPKKIEPKPLRVISFTFRFTPLILSHCNILKIATTKVSQCLCET